MLRELKEILWRWYGGGVSSRSFSSSSDRNLCKSNTDYTLEIHMITFPVLVFIKKDGVCDCAAADYSSHFLVGNLLLRRVTERSRPIHCHTKVVRQSWKSFHFSYCWYRLILGCIVVRNLIIVFLGSFPSFNLKNTQTTNSVMDIACFCVLKIEKNFVLIMWILNLLKSGNTQRYLQPSIQNTVHCKKDITNQSLRVFIDVIGQHCDSRLL